MENKNPNKDKSKRSLWNQMVSKTEFSVLIGLLILMIIMSFASPVFLTTTKVKVSKLYIKTVLSF